MPDFSRLLWGSSSGNSQQFGDTAFCRPYFHNSSQLWPLDALLSCTLPQISLKLVFLLFFWLKSLFWVVLEHFPNLKEDCVVIYFILHKNGKCGLKRCFSIKMDCLMSEYIANHDQKTFSVDQVNISWFFGSIPRGFS